MDWKKVGESVVDAAPLLGQVLLGPAGGAAGTLISTLFGAKAVAAAVLEAIKADPQSAIKLRGMELDNQLELQKILLASENVRLAEETKRIQEESRQIEAVNLTMRAETVSERWWVSGWRPYWGFSSGTAFFALCLFVCYLAYQAVIGKDANAITMIPNLIFAFTTLFGVPGAILGITAWHRGRKQRAEVGDIPAPKTPMLDRIMRR